jgi:hypothetical protein
MRNALLHQWIEDHVERETAAARQRVEAVDEDIRHEQDDTEIAGNMVLMTGASDKMFHQLMVALGDSLSDIATSDDEEDWEDENEEEIAQGTPVKMTILAG